MTAGAENLKCLRDRDHFCELQIYSIYQKNHAVNFFWINAKINYLLILLVIGSYCTCMDLLIHFFHMCKRKCESLCVVFYVDEIFYVYKISFCVLYTIRC